MSRTDKDRPYDVQLHDKTLNIVERHNHSKGECDLYTLEKWKRRFNNRSHRVYGSGRLRLSFSCEMRTPDLKIHKMFPRFKQEDPGVLMLRTQLKRKDRHNTRQQSWKAVRAMRSKRTMEVLDDLGDELTEKRPRRSYHNTGQPYSKKKRPYVSRHRWQPTKESKQEVFDWYDTYHYAKLHRLGIKSMHGRPNKAAA